jgi:5-oxoprolinase (ATP-hydrolysing) subunit C
MTGLLVTEIGPGASIQDHGRAGWRRFGISTAGAMDRLSLAIANVLVGNAPDAAAIETVLASGKFQVADHPVLLATSGPGVTLAIDGRAIPAGQSAEAMPGQTATISAVREGVYGYLAVAGGVDFSAEMGSRASHRRSGLGPPPIRVGMTVPVEAGGVSQPSPLRLVTVPHHDSGPIRFIWGPQEDWFGAEAHDGLMAKGWTIGQRSDRMGVFLDGPSVAPVAGSLVTDGVVPGSIQVPPAGTPVILMRDCQTTGGYPKIATVISADLDRLAQVRPGTPLNFTAVSREEAIEALRIARVMIDGLRPEPAIRQPDTSRLMQTNLIDGVWGGSAQA